MVEIRPMTAVDIEPVRQMIMAGEWGDRRVFLEFATTQPECLPIVAVDGGEIVASGVGTANGPAGWIGAIFVDERVRRRGIGRAVTDAVIAGLEQRGCQTLVLVASEEGKPLYEGMGFQLQTAYATLEAPGTSGSGVDDGAVRPFDPGDLEVMSVLDREATGEARGHLLTRLASPESARVLVDENGGLSAFTIRPPWGGGATIAETEDAGTRILQARRAAIGPDRKVRAGLPLENRSGIRRLQELGWTRSWNAPRMIRGEPLDWHPEQIWGQFAMALG
ncbi:MAG TPA: GNAT family N-acetyltransferase [Candidatus Polarisedimenticolia bacterium]|nr:GNAT family N-acetyltransferase [Candidatus Polarisedimenticolia bacterium]